MENCRGNINPINLKAMKLHEIKYHLDNGRPVFWLSDMYQVTTNSAHEYVIECQLNGHCIGLTWSDGKTLNGQEQDFYYKDCNGVRKY